MLHWICDLLTMYIRQRLFKYYNVEIMYVEILNLIQIENIVQ